MGLRTVPGENSDPVTGAQPVAPRRETNTAPGTVLSLDQVAADLIRFTLERPPGFDYAPGNSVKLSLDNVTRSYSMVSAPHERDLEFFVELLPGGKMASRLSAIGVGSRIGIASKAKRGLSLDGKASRHLMFATVTGINPFLSLLRDAAQRGLQGFHCILVHAASYADEFGYDGELRALSTARPELLTYIPTVSRPNDARNADWSGFSGRADSHIDDVCRDYNLSPADTVAYACGNPGMVDEARARLGQMNYRIQTERYK